MAALRGAETIGRPLGSPAFLDRLAALTGRDPRLRKPGPKPTTDKGCSNGLRPSAETRLTCIIQPGAPRFEKMRVERYVAVLLLSAGHVSASRVVDQRWDLHLFVG
jgi:hypothetical protein